MRYLLLLFLLFLGVQVWAVALNLPERFEVKGIPWEDIYKNKSNSSEVVFHFENNKFWFSEKRHGLGVGERIYDKLGVWDQYFESKGEGIYRNGVLSGKVSFVYWIYSVDFKLYTRETVVTYLLKGKTSEAGVLDIKLENGKIIKDSIRNWIVNEDQSKVIRYTNRWIEVKPTNPGGEGHYIYLQLPLNQPQSIQTVIKEPKPEKTPMPQEDTVDTQPILTLPDTTNMSMSIGAQDPIPKTETDPCKDPNQDAAMKEYCANKAYNIKLEAQQKKQDDIEEKKIEEELAREEIQERQLEALEKEQAAQREAWRQRQKVYEQQKSDKLASDMQQLRQKHAEIKKAHKIVDLFGEDDESKRLAHKKIDALKKKNNTLEGTTKIKQAIKKQFYDAKQEKLQGEAAVEMEKVKAWDKSIKRTKTIRDSAMTANKVIAKFDPTGTGDKIVSTMEHIYTAAEGYDKNNSFGGMVNYVVEKKASDISGGWSDTAKESIETYKDIYSGKEIKLKKHEYYYDKSGKRVTTYKKGDKVYDKKHQEITYSFQRRLLKNAVFKLNNAHNVIKQAADKTEAMIKATKSGNINSMINAGMELKEVKEGIGSGTNSVVNKLTGEGK